MKKIFTFIVFALLLGVQARAAQILGGNITYKYAGSDSIDVTLTFYKSCSGVTSTSDSVKIATACGSKFYKLLNVSVKDVTGVGQNCSIQSRCTGSYQYGFHEYVFTGRVGLGTLNTSCCNYTISWNQYGRSGAITTGAANSNFYIETKFNRCLAPNNSSPVFQSTPKLLISLGQDQSLSYKANDADGDLLTYELTDPLSDSVTTISYSGQWKSSMPITFLGFPKANLSQPAGFRFDSLTGNVNFRTAKKDEVTVIVMKVTEWRKISGTYTKIGETLRDIQYIVVNSPNNKVPTFNDSNNTIIKTCGSTGTFCTDIKITDSDSADTISMVYKHQLKNITFNNIGTANKPVIRVCYTPDSAEIASGKQLAFTIEVKDNACPLPASLEKTYVFNVGTNMPDSFGMVQNLSCGTISLGFVNKSSTITGLTPTFEVTHNSKPITVDINSKITNITSAGWYYTKLTVQSSAYCDTRVYTDSILVLQSAIFNVDAGTAQKICGPAAPTLTSTVSGGASPYKYQWSTGTTDSLASVTFTPTSLGEKYYLITVTDKNGCIASDSVQVGYYNPQVTIFGNAKQCRGLSIQLQATITDTVSPTFGWVGFALNKPNVSVNADVATTSYNFTLNDNGCIITKQHLITVYNPIIKLNNNLAKYCDGDSVKLSASASGITTPPFTFFWDPYGISGSTISLGKPTTGIHNYKVYLTDSFGCSTLASGEFQVFPYPQVLLSAPSIICESSGALDLKNYALPNAGSWSGPGVVNNIFYPANSGSGLKILEYSFTEFASGCRTTKTTSTLVDVQPVASFTVDSVKGPKGYSFKFTNTSKMGGLNFGVWNFGDPNSGANNVVNFPNPTHTFSDTGRYTVKLSVNGGFCPPDSITKSNYIFVYLNTLSVNERINNNIIIYPNPASSQVSIESGFEIKHLWLTDMLGREVYPTYSTDTYTAQIQLNNVAAGTYMLTVESKEGLRSNTKLVITR